MPLQLRVFLAVVGSGVAVLIVYSIVTGPLFHLDPFEGQYVLQFSGHVREQGTGKPLPGVFVLVNITSWRAAHFGNGATTCGNGSQVVRTDAQGNYRVLIDWWRHGWPVPRNIGVALKLYSPGDAKFMVVGESFLYSARSGTSFEVKPDKRSLLDRLRMLSTVVDGNCVASGFEKTFAPLGREIHNEAWRSVCQGNRAPSEDELLMADQVMSLARLHVTPPDYDNYERGKDTRHDELERLLPGFRNWVDPGRTVGNVLRRKAVTADTRKFFCDAYPLLRESLQ